MSHDTLVQELSATVPADPSHSLANALIVVDVQNDFCPGGSLAVEGGDLVATRINQYIRGFGDDYRVIVATKDWHPANWFQDGFAHFADDPDFKDTWPVHCVANTPGAMFHPNLKEVMESEMIPGSDPEMWVDFDAIFFKGQREAAYSGFEGYNGLPQFGLDAYLKQHGIGHVDVVGLATDYCVKATAIDAVKNGYSTGCLASLCAGVAPDTTKEAIGDMMAAGVQVEGYNA